MGKRATRKLQKVSKPGSTWGVICLTSPRSKGDDRVIRGFKSPRIFMRVYIRGLLDLHVAQERLKREGREYFRSHVALGGRVAVKIENNLALLTYHKGLLR